MSHPVTPHGKLYTNKRVADGAGHKVKYAIVAANVARLSPTTAKETPSLTIMFVVPTVLSV